MSTSHAMARADAAWLHMDRPTNLMVINSVLWFDEPVDWDAYTAVIRDRLLARFDRFRQRPVEGPTGPHWEDVEVDLELHVHHVALPAPGDRRALETFVSDRAAMPLDRSRPLWEVYLIDGFGDGAAVLTRMHHCIADGITLARVMLTLTDGGPDPDA
ncbi:MAG TPA: wax ester/triacylglycerol synthase domain-containing protein, partial [Solirubrobacteraceae bacterium]|nr:wax ester/triacylglycerol synthase domain-containing protein [Solirubrobacteraceae bacterium]